MNNKPTIVTNNIFILKINAVENASAVNIGENYLQDWNNSSKHTQGFGHNYGDDSDFYGLQSKIDDRDLIDAPAIFNKNHSDEKGELDHELCSNEY